VKGQHVWRLGRIADWPGFKFQLGEREAHPYGTDERPKGSALGSRNMGASSRLTALMG
jgi:hypothetical protein